MADLPSGTVTFLFTDIEGSTRLLRRLGEGFAPVLLDHHRLLRTAFAAYGGHEVDTQGDAFFVAFAHAPNAIAAAVAAQRSLAAHAWPGGISVRVRMGLHTGEPQVVGDRYIGLDVHQAARICSAAHGGQLLVSQATAALTGAHLPPGVALRHLGDFSLKDFDHSEAIYQAVLNGLASDFPPLRTPQRPALEVAAAVAEPASLVGRARELATLRGRLAAALEGQGGLVLLAGEAGIGKTRLCEELAEEARQRGAEVLWGRCYEEEGAPAYWPWLQILRTAIRAREPAALQAALGAGAATIAHILPELHERLPGSAEAEAASISTSAAPADQARFRLFDAIAGFFRAMAQSRILLLIIDDLQWADRPSLLLLQFLVRSLGESPILLLGAYRDIEVGWQDPLGQTLAEIRRERHQERLVLAGLAPDEVAALLARLSGRKLGERERALAETLHVETEGNPFFIEEIVRHLIESGRMARLSSTAGDAAKLHEALEIPAGVREVIGRRLARLSPECNRVLTLAALAGREVRLNLLERVGEMQRPPISEDDLLQALDEAVAARVMEELSALGRYRFTHSLIRDTLSESLGAGRRARLHRQIGEALELYYGTDPEAHLAELAYHFVQAVPAGMADKAIEYSLRAGEAAAVVFAWEEAAAHWQAALNVMAERGGEPERRARLLERLGELMFVTRLDWDLGVRSLTEARELYALLGLREREAEMHIRLGRFLSTYAGNEDIGRAMQHFHAARALLDQEAATAPLGHLYLGLASAAFYALHYEEGMDAARRALEIGRLIGDVDLETEAAADYGIQLVYSGRVREGQALTEEAWHKADRQTAVLAGFMAARARGAASRILSDPRTSQAWYRRELAAPRLRQAPLQRQVLLGHLAQSSIEAGDLDEARRALVESGDRRDTPHAVMALVEGRWEESAALLQELLQQARASTDRYSEWTALLTLVRVQLTRDDTGGAEALLEEALSLAGGGSRPAYEMYVRPYLAQLLARRGDLAGARAHVARCHEIQAGGEDWRGLAGRLKLAEALALLLAPAANALPSGAAPTAGALLHEALATFQQLSLPWDEADACLAWARALATTGAAGEAASWCDAADAIYRRTGTVPRYFERSAALRTAFAAATPAGPRLPLRAGVTGHRPNRLRDADLPRLRVQVRYVLAALLRAIWTASEAAGWMGDSPLLRIVSPLAEGADRIIAEEGLALGAELHAPLPFARADYEPDFADPTSLAAFRAGLARAASVTEGTAAHGTSEQRNEAYHAVGLAVLAQSDLLLAIWDGLPARGRGGTAEIVQAALDRSLPVVCIDARVPHDVALLASGARRPVEAATLAALARRLVHPSGGAEPAGPGA